MAIRHTHHPQGRIATIRSWKRDPDNPGEKLPVFQNVPLYKLITWDTNKYAPAWLRPDMDETLEGRGIFERVTEKVFSKLPKLDPRTW